jgi:hypothetical protein
MLYLLINLQINRYTKVGIDAQDHFVWLRSYNSAAVFHKKCLRGGWV